MLNHWVFLILSATFCASLMPHSSVPGGGAEAAACCQKRRRAGAVAWRQRWHRSPDFKRTWSWDFGCCSSNMWKPTKTDGFSGWNKHVILKMRFFLKNILETQNRKFRQPSDPAQTWWHLPGTLHRLDAMSTYQQPGFGQILNTWSFRMAMALMAIFSDQTWR